MENTIGKTSLIKLFIHNKIVKDKIYEDQEAVIQELLKIKEPLVIENEDGTWTRIAITDNAENLDKGFYASARVSRYSTRVDVLKNMPKELKELVA